MPRLTGIDNITQNASAPSVVGVVAQSLIPDFRIVEPIQLNLISLPNIFLFPSHFNIEAKQAQYQNPVEFGILSDIILPNITVDTTKTFTNNTNVTADRT